MMFTQCNDLNDCNKHLPKDGIAWVTPDFKVYTGPMIFSDGACWLTFEPSTLHALYELQTYLEFFSEEIEMSFEEVESDAKELADSYRAAMKAIKFKPLVQEKF